MSISTVRSVSPLTMPLLTLCVYLMHSFELNINSTMKPLVELPRTNPYLCIGWIMWLLFELVFIQMVKKRFAIENYPLDKFPKLTMDTFTQLEKEVDDPRSIPDLESYLEGWFQGVPLAKIGRNHMLTWLSGILFSVSSENADADQLVLCEKLLIKLEGKLNRKFEFKDTKVPIMLLTLDPPNVIYRPILFYTATLTMDLCTRYYLRYFGFQRYEDRSLHTFHLKRNTGKRPLVFFHGIGVGIAPYIRFVIELVQKYPDRSIILFEMPHVSMKLASTHCYPREYADLMAESCRKLGVTSITAIGHSLGTISIRWLDLFHPNLIHGRVFLDPVCFALWNHHVAYNFLYKEPQNVMQKVIRYVACTEPGIALYLRRFFVWYENTYYSNDLPSNSVIYLAEKDDILFSKGLFNYLTSYPCNTRKVKLVRGTRHGQFMLGGYSEILDDINYLTSI